MKLLTLVVCPLLVLGAIGCTSPFDPGGAVTVTTAAAVAPANGAYIANSAQPITLAVRNGLVADSSPVSYTFEVATDSGFGNVVQSKDVSETPDRTSVQLDVLSPGRDYYWRVQTIGGGTRGEFTTAQKFTIGPTLAGPPPSTFITRSTATALSGLGTENLKDSNVVVRRWRDASMD